jgi:hypothetical protein
MVAGKSNPSSPIRRGQRPYVDLDPADSLLLRQIDSKTQVAIIQLRNLNVEIQTLREEQKKLRSVVLTLLADPQAREDALAVLREWRIETYKKNSSK